MAFFKFRKASDAPAPTAPPVQSMEAIRQRAKHRLVGATVLVLAGVLGLPLLFDKQPRPIAVDTPIDIPDRHKVLPLALPASAVSTAAEAPRTALVPQPQAAAVVQPPAVAAVKPSAGVITEEAPVLIEKIEQKVPLAHVNTALDATKNKSKESPKDSAKVVSADATQSVKAAKPAVSAQAPVAQDARALALLEGGAVPATTPAAASAGRFVVQVGAFADAARAHEVRLKLERAGLKTYTHVADTKDGKRIRVRVGPFAVKTDAEKAAEKIKKLNLPAALLTL